ncbi:hypothetical protein QR90_11565 [Deinococcus radiopugnans]|uniref:Uncharacterized protein n=2 Tax=Deinococcus radiopugnans TaxID=57497 RepID=A0A0A7KHL1_9DEIO|nr:hypothetical protein [Deinococcus radiopugnans]AIZ45580.1 hypothetical protein QR90_11565 [Deinococcus radiopugnans]MBB6014869.1 hypothetical protein [Deinococcus radiopugnans ATCC 19172]QLG11309.1 hypothetical protein HLB42_11340 [Deinococcus sp. D7000]TNM71710.1 hypothetical protein FHR04_07115 [Deinococcus radiopugnans ATCC 19172]
MSDDKSTAGNMLDAAKAKINEGADRARAAGHDLASNVGGTMDNMGDKAKATEDRAKAEVHNAEAHANYNEGKREAKDGDGH